MHVNLISVPYWPFADTDGWILAGSISAGVTADLLDGDRNTHVFTTNDNLPWLKIDMQSTQLVKAVIIKGRNNRALPKGT